MAGLRTLAMKFTGDSKDLDTASDKAAKGLSRVGESAENLDDKGSKATDSLGALSSGFELVGLDQYAAGLQSAAMATDFLSGVGTGLNLIMELQSVQFLKAKVATLAQSVAQKAAAATSLVWATAQRVLNAAMTANPIGLVIAAIAALVAIFIVAYKKSDTFRAIVQAALAGVRVAAQAVAAFFSGPFVAFISGAWSKITGGASAAKNGIVSAFNTVVGFVKGLPGRIASAASGMWGGITGAFKSAINWIIGKWNNLSFGIPAIDTHIPGVGKVGGFTLNTPDIPYLAKGGTAFSSGLAVTGEAGPELVDLNAGARVTPLDQVGGGDVMVYITIDGQQLQGRIDKTVRADRRELKRTVKAG